MSSPHKAGRSQSATVENSHDQFQGLASNATAPKQKTSNAHRHDECSAFEVALVQIPYLGIKLDGFIFRARNKRGIDGGQENAKFNRVSLRRLIADYSHSVLAACSAAPRR